MTSYHNMSVVQHQNTRFESPAKVFAKLKSKVQREAILANDPLCNVRKKHGADFNSPRKRTESTGMPDELKENHKFGSYINEAEALTLSPISSPQKNLGYLCSDLSSKPDKGNGLQSRTQQTPTKRALLEGTDVFHPLVSGFTGTSRTPVKKQRIENSCADWMPEEDCAHVEKPMSPRKMFSPISKSVRKRKLIQEEKNKVSSSTKEVCMKVTSQPQERKCSAALSEDDTHYNISAGCDVSISLEKLPPKSPAKMFAMMKTRENRQEQQEVHEASSSTRQHMTVADNTGETVDGAFRGVTESRRLVNRSRLESADSQSDTDPSDIPSHSVPSQPVLFEDSLVLNSPRITVPKKNKAVFKHNKWSQDTTFPAESMIHLSKWFIRRNQKGLFVDGFCKEGNVPWNSNIITERISNSVVRTISGRVYILVGKMHWVANSEFPKWLLKEFAKGFPPNWKDIYEKFLSESRENQSRETERNSAERNAMDKMTSKDSAHGCTVTKHRQQKTFKTPDSIPPATSSSSAKVSRSGRVIKPPLEYWKGGRVIVDAHMNVTIYEGYNNSICQPELNTTVCAISQKPAQMLCSKGRKQYESTSDNEMPAPLRRVKAPRRKRNRAKVNPEERPPRSTEPPLDSLSPEEWPGNIGKSNRKRSSTKKLYANTTSPSQSVPEKTATLKSKREAHNTNRPSLRSLRSRQTATPSEASPCHNSVSPYLEVSSSDDEFTDRTKKQGKGAHRKRGEKKSPPKCRSSRKQSSKESGTEQKKTSRVTKQKQSKTSPTIKTLSKVTQSSKKHKAHKVIPQKQDEDEWTDAELIKLKQAVSCYPKHQAGYWEIVARMVGTRSAEECHNQHTLQGNSRTPPKKARKTKKKVQAAQEAQDCPVISAGVGTFKRKQQVRQFLENMPRDNVEDAFSTAYMYNKRFEIPSMGPSEENDITMSDLEPMTPMSKRLHEAKTPQGLHITPGMMGSPNRNNGDKYVYKLQKRMKKSQFNIHKQASSSKSFTPTPAAKQKKVKRCTENDVFVVWEMFPEQEPESGEEQDLYFSDNE